MTAILIIVAAIILLVIGYIYYGSWLAKEWGIDETRTTPAVELEDGVDYVAAKPIVLMGHHFSSIAGAGPINGPIQASLFGWLPVFLWCVIGGIFFGGLQDFGSLFASIRNDGKSVGEIIESSMGPRAKKLFLIFALLVMIMVIASFVNIVAGTYASERIGFTLQPTGNETTAIISLLFIILAIIYGILTNRVGIKTLPATIGSIVVIVLMLAFGLTIGFALNRVTWIILIGIYISIASLVPVWILLQPRDYLSSFLLYGMMILGLLGIFYSAFAGTATFQLPAFTGWSNSLGFLFPALFITVACGACSGFHSLISTGTSSKQLASEADAKPIGYGSMLIESALAIVALIAVGMVFPAYTNGDFGSPAAAFASGIAIMFGQSGTAVYQTVYALLTLAVSVFALTSLDTGTRLSRFLFSELFLKPGEASYEDATGIRKFLTYPLTGTVLMVVIGCVLGYLELSQIWSLFGAANQLLAALALMAVSAWLANVGKNNKMFYIPMVFMLLATVTSLATTIFKGFGTIAAGGAEWGVYFQVGMATAMIILALVLVILEGKNAFVKKAT